MPLFFWTIFFQLVNGFNAFLLWTGSPSDWFFPCLSLASVLVISFHFLWSIREVYWLDRASILLKECGLSGDINMEAFEAAHDAYARSEAYYESGLLTRIFGLPSTR
jgi:hypothetical protein